MRLVISEKPSLARAISSAIDPKHKKADGSFVCEGGKTVVTWLLGHVLEQFQPDDYCEEWKKWTLDTLPIVPQEWKLKETKNAKSVIVNAKTLLKNAKEVVHAGDPDREGELLVSEFLEFFKWKGRTLRLLLKDLTPESIRKSFASMRDISEFEGLKNSAIARQRADWLVGMNGSRYFTIMGRKNNPKNGVISVGRVQTPTLGLVARRDIEIENFSPVAYYSLFSTLELHAFGGKNISRSIVGLWQSNSEYALDEENRLRDMNVAVEIMEKIKGKTGTISKYEKKPCSESPPLPYRLSDLQAETNRKFGFTLKETLDTVQSLYEKQLVSYPRSDCPYLPESHHANAKQIIDGVISAFPSFGGIVSENVDLNRKSKAFNDGKVAEHYGITPTGKVPSAELSERELKIFSLICVRYLLQFFPNYEYLAVTAEFQVENETFRANGRELLNIGWHGWSPKNSAIQEQEDKEDGENENPSSSDSYIPSLTLNETGNVGNVEIQEKTTAPPKHFTDGTLVKAMSNIHLHVTDPEIKKQLREIDGIGTSATQYQIVEKLISRGFIQRKKKKILSADTGRALIATLESGDGKFLAYPDMTAIWEREISRIERGENSVEAFLDGICVHLHKIIREE